MRAWHWGSILLILACAVPAAATELVAPAAPADSLAAGPVSFEWSATYASRYSFQGIDYSEGRPVLQPEATANVHGLALGVWINSDQTRRELNEIDASLQRSGTRGPLAYTVGYTHLSYPNRDWSPTHELVTDLELDRWPHPSLSVHWDVGEGQGGYWAIGGAHEFTLHPGRTLGLGARVFAQQHYYGMTGIPAIETSVIAGLPWAGMSIQPALARQWAWENGQFRGDLATRPGWVFSITLSPR